MQMNNSLQCEIAFLHGLADCNMEGQALPGEAFGIGTRAGSPVDSSALKSKDYCFTIANKNGVLELEVDTYTAINGWIYWPDKFDVDAWDGGKIIIESALPPGRQAYRHLHQAARILLAGRNVRLDDGTPGGVLVHGVKVGEGVSHA